MMVVMVMVDIIIGGDSGRLRGVQGIRRTSRTQFKNQPGFSCYMLDGQS